GGANAAAAAPVATARDETQQGRDEHVTGREGSRVGVRPRANRMEDLTRCRIWSPACGRATRPGVRRVPAALSMTQPRPWPRIPGKAPSREGRRARKDGLAGSGVGTRARIVWKN